MGSVAPRHRQADRSPAILNKPGAPDGREWEILRRHPADGARIARPLHEWLGGWIDAIEDHHEKYDGSGYPHGLEGKDIPLAARIVSLTDAFETMTAVRSYKKPMSAPAARAELARCAGTHFDPDLVRAFLNISLGRLTWSVGLAAWLAQLPFIGSVPRAGAAIGRVGAPVPAYGGAVAGVGTVAFGVMLAVGAPSVDSPAVHDLGGDGPGNSRVVDSEEVQVKSATATRSEPAEHVGGTSEDAVPATGPAPASAKPPVPASPPARSGAPPGNGPGDPPPPGPPAPPPPGGDAPEGGDPEGGDPGGGGGDPGGGPGGGSSGSCPPGQAKDWSDHPHGGPPGLPYGGPPGLADRCG